MPRYYDRATGRFVSQDPLPLLQRYAYCLSPMLRLTIPLAALVFAASETRASYTGIRNADRTDGSREIRVRGDLMEHERKIVEFHSPVLEDGLDEALRAGSSTMSARHVILALLRQKELQRHLGLSDVPLDEVRRSLTGAPAPHVGPAFRFLAVTPSEAVNACLEEYSIVEESTLAVQLGLLHCLLKGEPDVAGLLAEHGIRIDI